MQLAFEPITLEEQVLRQDKMGKLRALSDAIGRAREDVAKQPGHWTALELQDLQRQYSDLRATLPKLRVV